MSDTLKENISACFKECNILREQVARLTAENERLNGLRPDSPPRPPDGYGLPRYGLRWNGPQQPLAVQMGDGYWTPWHLAERLKAKIERLNYGQGEPVAWRGINCYGEVVTDWIDGSPGPMVDLCGNPASYDSIEYAYGSPTIPTFDEIELPTVCASDCPHVLKRDIIEILEAAGIKVKK